MASFLNYLQNRKEQGENYTRKKRKNDFKAGDIVAFPIQRLDRSNLCQRNLPCRVLEKGPHGQLTLQCQSGILDSKIHEDQVGFWGDGEITFESALIRKISLIGACRSVTSYSKKQKVNKSTYKLIDRNT